MSLFSLVAPRRLAVGLLLTAFSVAGLGVSQASAQASGKIGYVDSDTIAEQLPEYQDVQKTLAALQQAAEAEFKTKQDAYQKDVEAFQQQSATMSDAAKQARVQTLTQAEEALGAFGQQKQQELAQKREELAKPLLDRINAAISTVAKAQGYTLVFNKTQDSPVLLYADAGGDLTFKVLDQLRRGRAATTPNR